MKYIIAIQWYEYKSGRYKRKLKVHRGVEAESVTQARDLVLCQYTNHITPSMSYGYVEWHPTNTQASAYTRKSASIV